MPLFAVRGRFANNFTFSVNPVDGADAKEALGTVLGSDEIRNYGHPVSMVSVKALSGSKKRIHISDKPAKERKGGGRKRGSATTTAAAPAPNPNTQPAQAAATRRR
jgi:hypothetical protein